MRSWIALACVLVVLTVGCDRSAAPPPSVGDDVIIVGSFNFSESDIVAELYAGVLRNAGFRVELIPQIGTRELVLPAMQLGLLDLVPEYAGSAVSFLGADPSPDTEHTLTTLQGLLAERGLRALAPAAAQSRNGFVVSSATAFKFGLKQISDLAPFASTLTFGGAPECPFRDLCLKGLRDTYGLEFASFLPLDTGGPLTAEAVERDTVDVGLLFTSDALFTQDSLVLLDDDRHLQPAENITPIVREDVLERFGPDVSTALDAVSTRLTTEVLRGLNAQVASGATPAAVAHAWLLANGLTTGEA
jgi:osmoprotectant transport system substrate-binding protein